LSPRWYNTISTHIYLTNILAGLALVQANPLLAELDLSSLEPPVSVGVDEKVYPEDHLVNSLRDHSMDSILLRTDTKCHLSLEWHFH